MRRLGIYVYFTATVVAQLLLVYAFSLLRANNLTVQAAFRVQAANAALLLMLALAQGLIKLFIVEHDSYENIIEWNIAVAMHVPFLIVGYLWRKQGYVVDVGIRKSGHP